MILFWNLSSKQPRVTARRWQEILPLLFHTKKNSLHFQLFRPVLKWSSSSPWCWWSWSSSTPSSTVCAKEDWANYRDSQLCDWTVRGSVSCDGYLSSHLTSPLHSSPPCKSCPVWSIIISVCQNPPARNLSVITVMPTCTLSYCPPSDQYSAQKTKIIKI